MRKDLRVDAVTIISTALAAVAAMLASISALASWRATKALEKDVAMNAAATRYGLVRDFEATYLKLYDPLWTTLGPWEDPVAVDAAARRAVHDVCQTLSSVYNAQRLKLIDAEQSEYLADLFLDWLRVQSAREVWDGVFRHQEATWPPGFVPWVDRGLGPAPGARASDETA
jgi:hypothetical protein